MRVALARIEQITPHIRTFWFKPERRVRYIAGQFTELHLPHEPADERGIRRWFTLSSSPSEDLIAITTRFDDIRTSTFKRELAALKPGEQLDLADPMGDFVLPKDPDIPLVFAATGLGITPVRSMIKWLHDVDEQRNIQLLYAATSPEELAFKPLFRNYNLRFTPIIKHPPAGFAGETGSLTAERIARSASSDALIYISGPEILIEKLFKELPALGVASERLVTDYFPGYSS